jgi:alpha-amylase
MNGIAWVLLAEGIPIIYYGTEQGFDGGNDPNNREVLWTTKYSTDTMLYEFISSVIAFRKKTEIFAHSQIQRYSDDEFYAFTRGASFVALTNQMNTITRTITYHPYSNGTKLCNWLDDSDCIVVQNNSFDVTMTGGLPKLYQPSS